MTAKHNWHCMKQQPIWQPVNTNTSCVTTSHLYDPDMQHRLPDKLVTSQLCTTLTNYSKSSAKTARKQTMLQHPS